MILTSTAADFSSIMTYYVVLLISCSLIEGADASALTGLQTSLSAFQNSNHASIDGMTIREP